MNCKLNFKNFYLTETDVQRQREGHIKMLIYGQNFIFFFHYDGNIYGGGEEARLTYANMKSDHEEGSEEMVFSANNLTSAVNGKPVEEFFRLEDISKIKVITNHVAEHLLNKQTEGLE